MLINLWIKNSKKYAFELYQRKINLKTKKKLLRKQSLDYNIRGEENVIQASFMGEEWNVF